MIVTGAYLALWWGYRSPPVCECLGLLHRYFQQLNGARALLARNAGLLICIAALQLLRPQDANGETC